jgi:hypothetical protein
MFLLERPATEATVRNELTLQRHFAAGRRAASARLSAMRQARSAGRPAVAGPVTPSFDREVA